jgi:hypothetical protein
MCIDGNRRVRNAKFTVMVVGVGGMVVEAIKHGSAWEWLCALCGIGGIVALWTLELGQIRKKHE